MGGQDIRFLSDDIGECDEDILMIGSDFAGGIVKMGIAKKDLEQDDPYLYLQHEADPETVWKKQEKTISEFLLKVVLDVLSMVMYDTAEEALEELDWEYTELGWDDWDDVDDENYGLSVDEILEQKGVSLMEAQKTLCESFYQKVFCCYDEEEEIFYVGIIDDKGEITAYSISHSEE